MIRKIRNEQKERLRKGCFFMAEETVDAKTRNDATNTTSEESRTGVNPPVGERRRLQLKPRNPEAAARIEAERRQSLEKVGVATSQCRTTGLSVGGGRGGGAGGTELRYISVFLWG